MEAGLFAHGQFAHGQFAHGQFAHGQLGHGHFAHGELEKNNIKSAKASVTYNGGHYRIFYTHTKRKIESHSC